MTNVDVALFVWKEWESLNVRAEVENLNVEDAGLNAGARWNSGNCGGWGDRVKGLNLTSMKNILEIKFYGGAARNGPKFNVASLMTQEKKNTDVDQWSLLHSPRKVAPNKQGLITWIISSLRGLLPTPPNTNSLFFYRTLCTSIKQWKESDSLTPQRKNLWPSCVKLFFFRNKHPFFSPKRSRRLKRNTQSVSFFLFFTETDSGIRLVEGWNGI